MRLVVLTGAGISAESGIGTFRDRAGGGLWSRCDPMKLATPEAFAADPGQVLAFYDFRRRAVQAAAPIPPISRSRGWRPASPRAATR